MPRAVTLHALYQDLFTGRLAVGDGERALAHRSELAAPILAGVAAEAPLGRLQDSVPRLRALLRDAPRTDSLSDAVTDAVCRESARLHLAAAEAELERRRLVLGGDHPTRSTILAAAMSCVVGDDPEAAVTRTCVIDAVRRAVLNQEAGASCVAAVLRAVAAPPMGASPHRDGSWARWAVALMVLTGSPSTSDWTSPEGVDPVTRATAARATRLFYGTDDAPHGGDPALLADGLTIASVLERRAQAEAAWLRAGWGHADLLALPLAPYAEEAGRPAPSAQMTAEGRARESAERAAGCPWPLALPIGDRDAAAELWASGMPDVPAGMVGLPVYTGGGDVRVRWGGPALQDTVRCAAVLPPTAVLHLHRSGGDHDDALFASHAAEAAREATANDLPYADVLRRRLLASGIRAIARYDHGSAFAEGAHAVPQEVVLLEPRGQGIVLVRESFPAFASAA